MKLFIWDLGENTGIIYNDTGLELDVGSLNPKSGASFSYRFTLENDTQLMIELDEDEGEKFLEKKSGKFQAFNNITIYREYFDTDDEALLFAKLL